MVTIYGTGKGSMSFGVPYQVHQNLVDKIVENGFATMEIPQEKELKLKKKKDNEKNI